MRRCDLGTEEDEAATPREAAGKAVLGHIAILKQSPTRGRPGGARSILAKIGRRKDVEKRK
jgi:hypothetical protein